jgi:hypothetical protein
MFKLKNEEARATIIAAYIGLLETTVEAIIASVYTIRSNNFSATKFFLGETLNAPTYMSLRSQTAHSTYTSHPTSTYSHNSQNLTTPAYDPGKYFLFFQRNGDERN